MTAAQIGEIAIYVLIVGAASLAGVCTHLAYRAGFKDGANWMHRGDTYPCKPARTWKWYDEARKRGLRPGAAYAAQKEPVLVLDPSTLEDGCGPSQKNVCKARSRLEHHEPLENVYVCRHCACLYVRR
jgi:hypothetical protein